MVIASKLVGRGANFPSLPQSIDLDAALMEMNQQKYPPNKYQEIHGIEKEK